MWVSLESFKNYLSVTSSTDDATLQDCLDSAQREIEGYCGRTFEPSTGVRYYRADAVLNLSGIPGGSGAVLLLGKDLLALGGLTNGDGTTLASTDCWLEPRNAPPYQYLRLKTGASWNWNTDGEITVSGTWGYSTEVPADIAEATREHAKYLRQLRRTVNYDEASVSGSETIIVSKGFPAHVKHILDFGGGPGGPGYVRRNRGII